MQREEYQKEYTIYIKGWKHTDAKKEEDEDAKEVEREEGRKKWMRIKYCLEEPEQEKEKYQSKYSENDDVRYRKGWDTIWNVGMDDVEKKELSDMLADLEDKKKSTHIRAMKLFSIICFVNKQIDEFYRKVESGEISEVKGEKEEKEMFFLCKHDLHIEREELLSHILMTKYPENGKLVSVENNDIPHSSETNNERCEEERKYRMDSLKSVIEKDFFDTKALSKEVQDNVEKYILLSIRDVFLSELILPDIFSDLIMTMVIDTPNSEISNFPVNSKKKWDSFKKKTSGYLEYEGPKYHNFTEDEEYEWTDYGRENYIKYKYTANPYLHNIILAIYRWGTEKVSPKNLLVYGKTKGKSGRYNYKQIHELEEGLYASNNLSEDTNITISDMLINRLVGHRYAMDLAYTLYSWGREYEFGNGRYKKSNKRLKRNPVLGDEIYWQPGKESDYRTNNFIEEATRLPIYWQKRFWRILQEFVDLLKEYEDEVVKKSSDAEGIIGLDGKPKKLSGEDYFSIVAKALLYQRSEIDSIVENKCGIFNIIMEDIQTMGVLNKEELHQLLKELLNENMLPWIKNELHEGTVRIWQDMIDFEHCQKVDEELGNFFSNSVLYSSENYRVQQRALGDLYDQVGKYFLTQNRK